MIRVIVLIMLLHSFQSLTGQMKFYSISDAKQIVAGEYFSVSFVLENARGSNFRAPSFVDFDVIAGPNTSTEMTFLNGQSKQKITYSYTLTSEKLGKYTLGSASIKVNSQVVKTQPLIIEVIKGKEREGTSEIVDDFLVQAVVDFDTAYVGQQITLKYELLTVKDVRSYNFRKLPQFDGFFAQEIQNYSERPERIVRDGVQYFKRILKVIALFPQQKGIFNIEPAQAVLGISDGRRSNSFFFNTRLKQKSVSSNGVVINVAATPRNPPLSFCGAIGDFYLGTSVDKKSITMDDAVTLTLQVRGYGDGKFIEAPKQPYVDLFDIYDPNLLNEKSEAIGDKIQVTKTYEYLMIPKKTGLITFNPELTYYDLDSARYITIYAQQYRLNVLEGTDRELVDLDNRRIDLPKPDPISSVESSRSKFFASPLHIAANGAMLLLALGLVLVRRIKDKRDQIDPAIKRKVMARNIAIGKLSTAKRYLESDQIKDYYIQLRAGIIDYLSDKTNLPSSQMSKSDIEQLLLANGLDGQIHDIIEIMKKGEQAIYASIAPGNEVADYERSLQLIEEIEVTLS